MLEVSSWRELTRTNSRTDINFTHEWRIYDHQARQSEYQLLPPKLSYNHSTEVKSKTKRPVIKKVQGTRKTYFAPHFCQDLLYLTDVSYESWNINSVAFPSGRYLTVVRKRKRKRKKPSDIGKPSTDVASVHFTR